MLEKIQLLSFKKILTEMGKRKVFSKYWIRYMKLESGLYLINASSPVQSHNTFYAVYSEGPRRWWLFELGDGKKTGHFKTRKEAAEYAVEETQ